MNMKMRNKIIAFLMSALIFIAYTGFTIPALAEEANIDQTPSGIPYAQLEQAIDSFVKPFIGKSAPGAAIVVTKGDEMIFSKGYGYANIEKQISVDPASTVFEYGSINKVFVWTAVMQLVEDGKIKLDQDIRAYLPESFAKKVRYDKPITMLDLMSHTAGFEESPQPTFNKSSDKLKSLEETLLFAQPEQINAPGKVMSYSNYGTALAAFAVEKVSGETFSDYEMKNILRPLEMNHTSGHPTLADHEELLGAKATGYGRAVEGGFEARAYHYVDFYPAGSMTGTAEDLARFALALISDDSLLFTKQETLQTMLARSYSPHKDLLSNAHGFWEYNAQPHAVGHAGNSVGFSSNFAVVPEEKLGIVVLTNAEVEPNITSGLIGLLIRDKSQAATPPSDNLSPSSEVTGHYVLSRNTFTTVQEIVSYLGLIRLEPKGEYDFTLSMMGGMSGEYKQISPNLFKLAKTDSKALEQIAPILYAEKTEGKVIRLSKGIALDILPVKPSRSFPALITYLIVAAIAIVFFLLSPLVLFVRWLLLKRRGTSTSNTASRLFAAVIMCGTAIVFNIFYLLLNVVTNQYLTVEQMNFGIGMNWTLAIMAGLLLVISILKSKQYPLSKGQKWFRVASTVIFVSFIVLLIDWNFFRIIG